MSKVVVLQILNFSGVKDGLVDPPISFSSFNLRSDGMIMPSICHFTGLSVDLALARSLQELKQLI